MRATYLIIQSLIIVILLSLSKKYRSLKIFIWGLVTCGSFYLIIKAISFFLADGTQAVTIERVVGIIFFGLCGFFGVLQILTVILKGPSLSANVYSLAGIGVCFAFTLGSFLALFSGKFFIGISGCVLFGSALLLSTLRYFKGQSSPFFDR